MRYQDLIIETTKTAANEAFRYAKAVPADKIDWKPMDTGRSVLDQCRELAMCAQWAEGILLGKGMPDWDEAAQAEMEKVQSAWTTVEACEEACKQSLQGFFKAVEEFPDERLDEKYTLPFEGGHAITMRENMDYPRWNFAYHTGQIAYIQTLYGDKAMYW